ncbi:MULTISPECIES: hypothetical protein [Hyphomicrobiales]|jgi:hypothetical protein|uniref:Uncharacterized protein n=1 Tax=Bosea massiliensis TaxID=151419 RepID=A0ABW0P004_9HYPH|nr:MULTISPECIES: hypothetical protein [Hyphomicrobiales]
MSIMMAETPGSTMDQISDLEPNAAGGAGLPGASPKLTLALAMTAATNSDAPNMPADG